MKVFLLADGQSAHTQKWVKSLVENGIELYLFTLGQAAPELKNQVQKGEFQLWEANLGGDVDRASYKKLGYLKLIPKLKKELNRFKPDLVHAHYTTSYGMLAYLSGFRPYAVSSWGTDVMVFPKKSKLHFSSVKQVLSKAAAVFASSKLLETILKEEFQLQTVENIPFGVDSTFFAVDSQKQSDCFIYVIVKSLLPTYGIDIAIKAFKLLVEKHPDKSLELTIYGDGPERSNYENLAGSELNQKITFKGRIDHSKVPQALNQADVFVNISRSESFGVSVLEASACGLAVIISNRGGLVETAIHQETGLVLPELNENECMLAMEKYLLNPELAKKHGKSGREFIQKNYEEKLAVKKQIRAYQEIIERKR